MHVIVWVFAFSMSLFGSESTMLTASDLQKRIDKQPRISLSHLPTPLIPLPRFSKALGGPQIYLKADNLTGQGGGGNKLRKLEFMFGEAMRLGATDIITQGATQSNHSRMTAAVCARLGLKCHLLLENRRSNHDRDYLNSGNILLDKLMGASVAHFPAKTDMNKAMQNLAAKLRSQGKKPYVIPGGASTPLGAMGYVQCAVEMSQQMRAQYLNLDYMVVASGSAGTHAGLAAGLGALNSSLKLIGISTRGKKDAQSTNVKKLALDIASRLGIEPSTLRDGDVQVWDDYVGDGYGELTDKSKEAIQLLAKTEGILLDPVYSSKAMAGLIDLVRKGHFKPSDKIVFLHTGGETSLYAYGESLMEIR